MIEAYCSIETIESIMDAEGFEKLHWPSQIEKEGQLAGWAKPVENLFQWHVRLYEGGLLDSEIEPHRKLVAHGKPADPYYEPLQDLLDRWGIAYQPTGTLPPDPTHIEIPSRLEWKHLFWGALAALGIAYLLKKPRGAH